MRRGGARQPPAPCYADMQLLGGAPLGMVLLISNFVVVGNLDCLHQGQTGEGTGTHCIHQLLQEGWMGLPGSKMWRARGPIASIKDEELEGVRKPTRYR